MVLSIVEGHQPVAQLCCPSLGGAYRTLLITGFVVFGAGINVLLAVAVMALGAPKWALLRCGKAPKALSERCRALAARRRAEAARLALGLVFELMTLPLVMRLWGLRPSHDAKRLALGHLSCPCRLR